MIQNICAVVGAITGLISLIWTIFQQKEIKKVRDNINLKNSGYIGSNAGGCVAGRDIHEQ